MGLKPSGMCKLKQPCILRIFPWFQVSHTLWMKGEMSPLENSWLRFCRSQSWQHQQLNLHLSQTAQAGETPSPLPVEAPHFSRAHSHFPLSVLPPTPEGLLGAAWKLDCPWFHDITPWSPDRQRGWRRRCCTLDPRSRCCVFRRKWSGSLSGHCLPDPKQLWSAGSRRHLHRNRFLTMQEPVGYLDWVGFASCEYSIPIYYAPFI